MFLSVCFSDPSGFLAIVSEIIGGSTQTTVGGEADINYPTSSGLLLADAPDEPQTGMSQPKAGLITQLN